MWLIFMQFIIVEVKPKIEGFIEAIVYEGMQLVKDGMSVRCDTVGIRNDELII